MTGRCETNTYLVSRICQPLLYYALKEATVDCMLEEQKLPISESQTWYCSNMLIDISISESWKNYKFLRDSCRRQNLR